MRVRNDISVRKRLTIGISGFVIVATGCYFTGRTIYRSRRAKKLARLEVDQKKTVIPEESVVPLVQEAFSSVKEELDEASVQKASEPVKEEGTESSPEITTPVPEEVSESVKEESKEVEAVEPMKEEAEPVKEPTEPTEPVKEPTEPTEQVVPVKQQEEEEEEVDDSESPVITEVDDDVWHPWWEGVKEISLYLSSAESDRLDEHFPSTHKFKYSLSSFCFISQTAAPSSAEPSPQADGRERVRPGAGRRGLREDHRRSERRACASGKLYGSPIERSSSWTSATRSAAIATRTSWFPATMRPRTARTRPCMAVCWWIAACWTDCWWRRAKACSFRKKTWRTWR